MITYIYHKDSTLHAANNKELIGALPVVNWMDLYSEQSFTHIMLSNDGSLPSVKPGETVALPGWGLEKVGQKQFQSDPTQRWYTRDQGWPYNDIHNYREAYRLVRSEPEKKRKKSNTLTGDDLLKQFVNKQIKLTVYSQKLWHSDKPFPVREHFHSLSFEDNQKLYLNHIKENWLSTANEVVNPEVIPQIKIMVEGDRKCLHFNNGVHSLRELNDGDQITLPHGYGTKWDTVNPCREVRKCLNERPDGDTCNQFNGAVCQRIHTVAVITRPEKPENSAHGYTEGSEVPKEKCKVWCGGYGCLPHHRNLEFEEDKSNCPGDNHIGRRTDGDLMGTKPFVEPSESQEEDQIDLLSEILVDYKTWLDDPESGMRDYETFQAKQLEKFTITRK